MSEAKLNIKTPEMNLDNNKEKMFCPEKINISRKSSGVIKEKNILNTIEEKLSKNSINENTRAFFAQYVSSYHVILIIGLILFLTGVIGYFIISGAQTGSCNTENSGCFVKWITSNQDSDNSNTSTQIVAEFFCISFLLIGTMMLVYGYVNRDVNRILKQKKQLNALLLLNGVDDDEILEDSVKQAILNVIESNPDEASKILGLVINNSNKRNSNFNSLKTVSKKRCSNETSSESEI